MRFTPATASCPRTRSLPDSARRRGSIWVGPSPATIEQMGDKAAARKFAQRSRSSDRSGYRGRCIPTRAVTVAEDIGYPVMLKAAAAAGARAFVSLATPTSCWTASP